VALLCETMSADIAVRGLVRHEGRVLLVRMTYGSLKGQWVLPGGLVGPGETLLDAAAREVREESGVQMKPESVIALRHYVTGDRSNLLCVVAGKWVGGEPRPDGHEVNEARFFTPAEALALETLYPVARLAITLSKIDAAGLRPHQGANPGFQFFLPGEVSVDDELVPQNP